MIHLSELSQIQIYLLSDISADRWVFNIFLQPGVFQQLLNRWSILWVFHKALIDKVDCPGAKRLFKASEVRLILLD